jgi:hypothetical protein
MKYQLVLQLPASSIEDYDAIIELEETLMMTLGDIGRVDGHDSGAGEMNIFILADDPKTAFEQLREVLRASGFFLELKVAYREVGNDTFSILYPAYPANFTIA